MGDLAVRLQREVDAVPFWWHSIDLGHGVITPGFKTLGVQAEELRRQRWPDLHGKSVLDIGTWDGFFAFEAERRGAGRVVALDTFTWDRRFYGSPNLGNGSSEAIEESLKHQRGFELARRALGSSVELVVADFTSVDLDELGQFDVVLFLGVLYHLEDPLRAIRRLTKVTAEVAIVETLASFIPGWESQPLFEFFPGSEVDADPTNWWSPNRSGLHALLRAGGLPYIDDLSAKPDELAITWPPTPTRYRCTLHARRRPLGPAVISV